MSVKDSIRRLTRSTLSFDFGNWALTPQARRAHMWKHYGIDTLVDIGANVGQYATEARRAGYDGLIESFEPVGSAFAQLRQAAAQDARWGARNVAVGANHGTLTMHISEGSIFSSPLEVLDETVAGTPASRQTSTEEVTVAPLDELLPDIDHHTAIKVDVQGFERDVLLGGDRSINRARIVELELSPMPVYEGQMLMLEAMERMEAAGLVLSLTENLLPDAASRRSLQFNGVFVRP